MQKIQNSRWKLNLWILWFTHLTGVMCFNFGVPFLPLYIQEIQPMSRETLTVYTSILSAGPAIAMGIMAPIWGYLSDRYGRKLMVLRASFSASILLSLMAYATSVNQLVVLRTVQGFLTGTITAAMTFVAADAPEEDMSYALGVISSATFIGFSIGPVIGSFFAIHYGYRLSFKAGGLIMLLSFLLVLFLVKENKENFFLKRKEEKRIPILQTYKNVILTPNVLIVLLMLFLLRVVRTIFIPYYPIFVSDFFQNSDTIVKYTGITDGFRSLSTALACYFVGKFAVKFDKSKLLDWLIFLSLVISALFTTQAIHGSLFSLFSGIDAFAFLYVSYYLFIGGLEPIVTSVSTLSVESENRGALFGLQGTVSSLAWFVSPVLGGSIAYHNGVSYVLLVIPIGLCLMLLAKKKMNFS